MRSVNIGELKARLSAHIKMVRDGEEVLVCDRNKPVARIVPCLIQSNDEREKDLIARGVLTPPLKRRNSSKAWPKPVGSVANVVIEQIWREEREEP